MRVVTRVLAAALLIGVAVTSARAADQTILGNSLQLKNPSTADKRKIVGKASEKGSPNTIVGDPTASGASITVRANGGTPSEQTFNLPQGAGASGKPYWTGDSVKGFKYKDAKGENGTAITSVGIKKSGSGKFAITLLGSSKINPITVLPPNPGTDGCILLTISGGDSYSVAFRPLDGTITNKGAAQYTQKKVSTEGTCVPSCPAANFNYGITAVVASTLRNWPGGSQTFGSPGCSVTVGAPSGNISTIVGDTWSVLSADGLSCSLTPHLPTCNTVGGTPSLAPNGRPVCSNSSDVLASGPSTADVDISCAAAGPTTTTTSTTTTSTTTTTTPCGAVVGGFCWYKGAIGTNCDDTCAAQGKVYDEATRTYAGSDGTNQNCTDVATAIGPVSSNAINGQSDGGYGCFDIDSNGSGFLVRIDSPATTSSATPTQQYRYCACQ